MLKQQGDNPLPTQEDSILDLRLNKVSEPPAEKVDKEVHNIPGLYQAQSKNVLSWHQTRTWIHNTVSITLPSQSSVVIEVTTDTRPEKATSGKTWTGISFPKEDKPVFQKIEAQGVAEGSGSSPATIITLWTP